MEGHWSRLTPWRATTLLATFVLGGLLAPILHRLQHAAEAVGHADDGCDPSRAGWHVAYQALDEDHCLLCERNLVARTIFAATIIPLLPRPVAIEPTSTTKPAFQQWLWPARAPPFIPSSMQVDHNNLPEAGELLLA